MKIKILVPLAAFTLAACSDPPPAPKTAVSAPPPAAAPPAAPHGLDPVKVARGGEIYQANCAVCHGKNAEGAPNWHKKTPDGKFPPPPLDGQGHGWHHSMAELTAVVRDGTMARGGGMPAWKGMLNDADIEAVLLWVQSRWPAEIYANWARMDEKSRQGKK